MYVIRSYCFILKSNFRFHEKLNIFHLRDRNFIELYIYTILNIVNIKNVDNRFPFFTIISTIFLFSYKFTFARFETCTTNKLLSSKQYLKIQQKKNTEAGIFLFRFRLKRL